MNWDNWILTNEMPIRLGFFCGIFALMGLWEILSPRRELSQPKGLRWANNLGLIFFNTALLRVLFPAAAVSVAAYAQAHAWGLLNLFQLPYMLSFVVAVVAMDFVLYLQHVMVHAVPVLWRLHRVHHADLDYDVTTGARFHTIEILLSLLIKLATIMVLGPPLAAVVIFEVLLNATAMFNHGNVYIPEKIDRWLRLLVVTPDMHRVHHSVHAPLANSNFGFNLPWWDRLFGTYVAQPPEGHTGMELGVEGYRDPLQVDRLPGMLIMPFVGQAGEYAINRRW
jgi:sterol desaturase/sphingolipid hydroxylase (fatty acid hydroxylase superfamily)